MGLPEISKGPIVEGSAFHTEPLSIEETDFWILGGESFAVFAWGLGFRVRGLGAWLMRTCLCVAGASCCSMLQKENRQPQLSILFLKLPIITVV